MGNLDKKAEAEVWLESLRPDIEKLCRDVNEQGKALVTGFVFCQNPPAIAHFGTVENQGDELVRLHLVMSSLAVEQEVMRYPHVTFRRFGPGTAPTGRPPEEIADELANLFLVTGGQPEYTERIYELAQSYLASRIKPPTGESK